MRHWLISCIFEVTIVISGYLTGSDCVVVYVNNFGVFLKIPIGTLLDSRLWNICS